MDGVLCINYAGGIYNCELSFTLEHVWTHVMLVELLINEELERKKLRKTMTLRCWDRRTINFIIYWNMWCMLCTDLLWGMYGTMCWVYYSESDTCKMLFCYWPKQEWKFHEWLNKGYSHDWEYHVKIVCMELGLIVINDK